LRVIFIGFLIEIRSYTE